jgi:septal ring factor EnvC (AmiA/AmiB activator)
MSNDNRDNPVRSTSSRPDLDWSQVKETVLMLRLAAAQVEFSLRDGGKSVDVLTDSFTSMAESIQDVARCSREICDKHKIRDELDARIQQQCQAMADKTSQAIMAFQFYDKLVQRLDHVVNSLSKLGELVGDSARLYSPAEWRNLQIAIRSRYSMDEERALFDALMNGEDIQSVMARLQQLATTPRYQDDVELF